MRLIVATFAVSSAFAALATTTSVETLVLDEDKVIDVASGDTHIIDAITGSGAYTLTKTGAGVLQIGTCENANARITVTGGTLVARVPLVPSLAADAFFHVDASLASTITSAESQGTNLVSKWTDVRGAGHPSATNIGKHQPYLTANYLNGRTVMDFGSYWAGTADNNCRWGAAMAWSEGTSSFKELFTVAMDTEDLKYQAPTYNVSGNYAGKRAGVWIGYTNTPATIDFVYRGNRTAVAEGQDPSGAINAQILNGSCKWASSARVAIDGVATGYSCSTPYPDGMHVLSLANTTTRAAYADRFASERGNAFGGLRMGETLVFTNSLSDTERAAIETYLQKKWLTGVFSLARLAIGEGCTLRLPQGGVVTADEYVNDGSFEGPGTVRSTRRLGTLNLKADAWIDVPLGEVALIDAVTNVYGYAIVKTGLGKLIIADSVNAKARLLVRAGAAVIGTSDEPVAAVLGEIELAEGTTLTVADGSSCAVGLLTDAGGTVAGTLTAGAVANGAGIAVTSGDVVLDPLANAPAFFHVDAAKTNSILISSSAPTNVVCWSDVRGRKAKNGGDKPDDAGNFAWVHSTTARNMPNWGGEGLTQNGLPVMDFGTVCYSTSSGDPYKCFNWNQGSWNVRDFILVVGDNENVKELEAKSTSGSVQYYRNQAFLGHTPTPGGAIGDGSALARGNRTKGSASPYILSVSTIGTGISFACDGVAVSNPTSDIFPDGLHVLSGSILESKVTSSNVYFNTFARERSVVFGGQRIGEALIFDHALTAAERTEYTDLLLTKWFGSNAVVRTHAAVSVPANTTLSLPNQSLAVTTSLTLGGTISAVSVTAPSTITVSGLSGAEIRGRLTLPASGTIVLGEDWKTVGGGKRRLLAARDIAYADGGSIGNWIVTLPAGARSSSPVLSQGSDGIYVTTTRGLAILIR